MFQVFLVRHGEVEGNSGPHPTFAGWADKPLTPRGVKQAAAVAARLERENIGMVWSSDLQRAHETARAIAAPHGLEVNADRALREVHYGAWESLGHEEIHRDWADLWAQRVADPLGVAPPGGENYDALWARLQPAWNSFLEAAENQTAAGGSKSGASGGASTDVSGPGVPAAVLVAHNGPLRLLLCHLLGIPVANYRRLKTSNCGVTTLEIETRSTPLGVAAGVGLAAGDGTRRAVVACVNETAHLRDLD